MMHIKQIIPSLLIAATLLGACADTPSPLSGGNSGPSTELSLDAARDVARAFFSGWESGDYGGMYGLISPNSQAAITAESFAQEYEAASTLIALEKLEINITETSKQGTTAVISYDATFRSTRFGPISDPGRLMRLIETADGWRVAWSRMDIFEGYTEETQLDMRSTVPDRGNIYDRNGKVMVDQHGTSVVLLLTKASMPDVSGCISLLSSIVHREYQAIEKDFEMYDVSTRFYGPELDTDIFQANQVNLAQLCGVNSADSNSFYTRTGRRYYNDLAVHLIGYVSQIRPEQAEEYARKGYPPDALVGQEGIEKAYEDVLAGQVGGQLLIIGPEGETVRQIAEIASQPGQNVYLTIDRDLQMALEQDFVDAYNYSQGTWAPKSPGAAAVVMDIHTGEILAMMSYPDYSPGLFLPDPPVYDPVADITRLQNSWRTPLLNRVTSGQFAAGSIFKIVSLAAGLDSGVFPADETITCTGVWSGKDLGNSLDQRTDWKYPDSHGPGIDARKGLTYSCDPYFWTLGARMHQRDTSLLPHYANLMGLGMDTGQEDLDEQRGYIPNPVDNPNFSITDTLNLVIGQGETQITPLQIVRMTAAVANSGTMLKPEFVSRVQPNSGDPTFIASPTATSTLDFKPEVFDLIRQAMCDVTTLPDGTANFIFADWYIWQNTTHIVCGKTGTAQTGGAGVKPQAWFTAFVPKDDPQIAISVIVENSCEGSEVAAPIVRMIIEDYYHMPASDLPPLWKDGCQELGE